MATGFENMISFPDRFNATVRRGLTLAASDMTASIISRVFETGEDTNNQTITNQKRQAPGPGYSDKGYFTSLDKFVKKPSGKKVSKGGFVSLPDGYKEFRRLSGRQTAYIDLDYTGSLRNAFTFRLKSNGFEVGFLGDANPSRGGTAAKGNLSAVEKSILAEDRNGGPIFHPTQEEITVAFEVIKDELDAGLS